MENILVPTDNLKEFNKTLNANTGFGGDFQVLPVIKYDAVNGIFVRSDDDRDEEGRTIYPTELGNVMEIHIINCAFQLVSSGEKAEVYVYSKEYAGQSVRLLSGDGKPVIMGKYKELKEKYDLRYKKVLYAYFGEELVRVFLSGYALTGWFPFLQANGNPARHYTIFEKGKERLRGHKDKAPTPATENDIALYKKDPKKINLFWSIKFDKKDDIPQDIIIDRVNEVNEYLINKNKDTVLSAVPEQTKQVGKIKDMQSPYGALTGEIPIEIDDVPLE